MNKVRAEVKTIEASGHLHRITLDAGGETFVVITLELGEDFVVSSRVNISFKSTHVAIARGLQGEVTISNRIASKVETIRRKPILTEVVLCSRAGSFTALITTRALERLGLQEGDEVTALMKASDLYLSVREGDA